jgi:hypothetical protein
MGWNFIGLESGKNQQRFDPHWGLSFRVGDGGTNLANRAQYLASFNGQAG